MKRHRAQDIRSTLVCNVRNYEHEIGIAVMSDFLLVRYMVQDELKFDKETNIIIEPFVICNDRVIIPVKDGINYDNAIKRILQGHKQLFCDGEYTDSNVILYYTYDFEEAIKKYKFHRIIEVLFGEREIKVTLACEAEITIVPCNESWEQYGGTEEQLQMTTPIAEECLGWLQGEEPYPPYSDTELMSDCNQKIWSRIVGTY